MGAPFCIVWGIIVIVRMIIATKSVNFIRYILPDVSRFVKGRGGIAKNIGMNKEGAPHVTG